MTKKILPEVLAYLNHTDNVKLREYREKIKRSPIIFFIKDLYKILKIRFLGWTLGNDIKKSYKRRNRIDKYWITLLLKEYREDVSLSEGAGRKIPFWNGIRFCCIDRDIALVVFALNKKGIKTNNACEGRSNIDDRGHSAVPYLTTEGKSKIPNDLISLLDQENVPYRYEEINDFFMCDSLHGASLETRIDFLNVLNRWAHMNGYSDINSLYNEWKNEII